MKAIGGVGVALVTPLNRDYSINFSALEKLIDHVTNGGVGYLVVLGTTGESPVFSWKEKLQILKFVFEKNTKDLPVVFGLGGNDTFDLIEKSKDLSDYNLTAILSTSPYYSKPSQQGIIRHYQMLGDALPYPIIIYNVPPRTASNIEAATTLELAEHGNIIAIKEASGNFTQCQEILKNKPEDFVFLSGIDESTNELIKNKAEGVISVIANLLPEKFSLMVEKGLNGEFEIAKELNNQIMEAYRLASREGNPSSIKAGLEVLDICQRTVKPPLFDGSDQLVADWRTYLSNLLTSS
ncbi:MAG: 4-hydroxy-tetrahydrodipicolinate synthase [Bacteroidota bacterium]